MRSTVNNTLQALHLLPPPFAHITTKSACISHPPSLSLSRTNDSLISPTDKSQVTRPRTPNSSFFKMAKHLKRYSNPTKYPDPLRLPNQLLSTSNSQKLQPSVDINLQAKYLTVSADFIKTPIKKPNSQIKTTVLERKDRRVKKSTSSSSSSSSSSSKELSKKKPQQEQAQVTEKKPFSLGGRRRSFCGAQVELMDVLANCGAKVVSFDMPPFMQIHAVNCARKTLDSLEKFTSKALAFSLKREFDGVYGPVWHCIVGTSFGSFVTHSVGGFLYFSMDQKLHILLFKTSVQRAAE